MRQRRKDKKKPVAPSGNNAVYSKNRVTFRSKINANARLMPRSMASLDHGGLRIVIWYVKFAHLASSLSLLCLCLSSLLALTSYSEGNSAPLYLCHGNHLLYHSGVVHECLRNLQIGLHWDRRGQCRRELLQGIKEEQYNSHNIIHIEWSLYPVLIQHPKSWTKKGKKTKVWGKMVFNLLPRSSKQVGHHSRNALLTNSPSQYPLFCCNMILVDWKKNSIQAFEKLARSHCNGLHRMVKKLSNKSFLWRAFYQEVSVKRFLWTSS